MLFAPDELEIIVRSTTGTDNQHHYQNHTEVAAAGLRLFNFFGRWSSRLFRFGCSTGTFTHVVLAYGATRINRPRNTFFRTGTGFQSGNGFFIHQCKQIRLIHHVEEIGLVLFLILIDGCIIVNYHIEGAAAFGLDSDKLLVGGLVIQQIAGIGITGIVNRFTRSNGFRYFLRLRVRLGRFLRLGSFRDRKILFGVLRIGEGCHRETAHNGHTERQHRQQTNGFLTHSHPPPSSVPQWAAWRLPSAWQQGTP